MNYHNPEQLKDWGQSDGWRLLTTEEKILPDDAEFFDGEDKEWFESGQRKMTRAECVNYRTKKPLPVSPLIAQLDAEIKAKQELREIALAVEAGAEWEVRAPEQSIISRQSWSDPDNSLEWFLSPDRACKWQVRLKPKPVTRPWSKPEDVPLNCWLLGGTASGPFAMMVVVVTNMGVTVAQTTGNVHWAWHELKNRKHSTDRINWKPCETEEAK